MIFITKIELKNFQSHKDSIIELHRGLNVIIGNSDSGKTALIRAIKWAIYNEPSGTYFIREGEKEASVTLHFSTGAIVRRYRSSSKNTYYLKKHNGEEYNFDGFGTSVPKEIIEEIEMGKVSLDNSNNTILNIADQLEGPFLLNERPALRASAIGRIVGVNYIDQALRETIRDSKQYSSEIKSLTQKKEELEKEIKKFDYLKDMEKTLNILLSKKKELKDKAVYLDKLENLSLKKGQLESSIEIQEKNFSKYKDLDHASSIFSNIPLLALKHQKILDLKNRLEATIKDLKENENIINKYKYTSELYEIKNIIEEKNRKFYSIDDLKNKLMKFEEEIIENEKNIDKYKKINETISIYQNIEKKLKQYQVLLPMYRQYRDIEFSLNKGYIYYKRFNNFENIKELDFELSKKTKLYKEFKSKENIYRQIEEEIKQIEAEYKNISIKIEKKYKEYEENILKLGRCPYCYNEINQDSIHHIRDHYKR